MTNKVYLPNNYIIPVEAVQERDTDLSLLEEIKCNKNFTDWLLERTINFQNNYNLIGAWHSLTQVSLGQSDLAFEIQTGDKQILFFIENKINADFQPNQAERYKQRGQQKIDKKECDEFYTILFAPEKYITRNDDFNFYLEYEDVQKWYSSQTELGERAIYKAEILEIAIEKLRRGYSPIINAAVTDFRWLYFDHANKHYPHLKMRTPNPGMPKKTGFIRFNPADLNPEKVEYIIHKQRGDVDLQLKRSIGNINQIKILYQAGLTDEMNIVQTGESVSIRIKVPKIDIELGFTEQQQNIEIALEKVELLFNWAALNLK